MIWQDDDGTTFAFLIEYDLDELLHTRAGEEILGKVVEARAYKGGKQVPLP
jgi:hypothetical protein